MTGMMSERLLRRALGYLGLCGFSMDTAAERKVLGLVSDVIAEQSPCGEAMDEVAAYTCLMEQVDNAFSPPEPLLPQVTPDMERGSIGYGDIT